MGTWFEGTEVGCSAKNMATAETESLGLDLLQPVWDVGKRELKHRNRQDFVVDGSRSLKFSQLCIKNGTSSEILKHVLRKDQGLIRKHFIICTNYANKLISFNLYYLMSYMVFNITNINILLNPFYRLVVDANQGIVTTRAHSFPWVRVLLLTHPVAKLQFKSRIPVGGRMSDLGMGDSSVWWRLEYLDRLSGQCRERS